MRSRLPVVLLTSFLLISVTACGDITSNLNSSVDSSDDASVWIFAQFNIPKEGDIIEDYYYIGEVSASTLQDIESNNRATGFITLENIRYWNNDDVIEQYEDDYYSGTQTFRIEDLIQYDRMKEPYPIGYIYAPEDDSEMAMDQEQLDDGLE